MSRLTKSIQCPTVSGNHVSVMARSCGELGVHKSIGGFGWTIVHMRTGLGVIPRVHTRSLAVHVATLLSRRYHDFFAEISDDGSNVSWDHPTARALRRIRMAVEDRAWRAKRSRR
jgi:hypothetical protein